MNDQSFNQAISAIKTKNDFIAFVADIERRPGYKKPEVFAIGIVNIDKGKITEITYPYININTNYGTAALLRAITGHLSGTDSYIIHDSDILLIYDAFTPYRNDGQKHENIDIVDTIYESKKNSFNSNLRFIVTFIDDLTVCARTPEDAYLRRDLWINKHKEWSEIDMTSVFTLMASI